MKKILFIITLVSIAFLGCDGKERIYKSNTQVLKEHKLLDSFSEKVEYIPEQYSEVITDTLLSNGFKVKVKYFVDMENSVLKLTKGVSLQNKTFYRNNIINISIEKNDKQIFNKTVNNSFFIDNLNNPTSTLKDYVLTEGYITYNDIYIKDKITFSFSFTNHISNESKYFQLEINNSGNFEIFENKKEPDSSFY